ncbi:WXG100 family type VII secretion target [Saccharothrix syringae]|uniref:Outer membrane channel protein CpnT-like N-terminal domain-containing protein n=1 Tax=Saccharothrix syringae TaxID=103733 RepID=A0A5Q0GT46_SACSY|nr:WXG100 family type VII secretion target [Saccharothrix syringae]QFZ16532.1 hypothetical protein EKG83_02775 [Saccharothrix syringae]
MSAQATTQQGRDPSYLISDVQGTVAAVERGDWVQAGLGMANTAMGIVGLAANPLSGFLSAGFSWAIQHVDFLREPFDALLGNPQAIEKMSASWMSAAKQIEGIVADYRRTAESETKGWSGRSADGYRAASKKHASGLETLAKATQGISRAAKGAGELVATVRKTIMDLISKAVSDMVMKIIQWLAASFLTFGAAIAGAIADIVQMACNYAKKLVDFLQKLANSLKKLIDLIKTVSRIAQTAKQILQAITAMTSSNKGGAGGGGAGPRPSRGGLGLTDEQLRDMDRGANDRYTRDPGATNPSAGGGHGAGPIVSRPPTVGVGQGPGGGGSEPVISYPGGPGGPVVSRPPTVGQPGWGTPGSGGSGGGTIRPGVPGGVVPGIPTVPGTPPGSGSGGGGHWEPGRWVPGPGGGSGGSGGYQGGSGGSGGYQSGVVPPYVPSGTTHATNTDRTPGSTYVPPVRPATPDLPHGGGGGGGVPGGGFGGGGGFAGGGAGGFGGGGAGGTGATLQAGGQSGVVGQAGTPAAAGGAAGAAAAARPGGAGGAGMGMMGGAPMAGAQGQNDGKDHQRKVRLEGEPLIDEAPKAAKPIIGE